MDSFIKYPSYITSPDVSYLFRAWFLPIVGPLANTPPDPNTLAFSIGWGEREVYLNPGTTLSQVTLNFSHVGWLFVSEIEVYE